MKTLINFKWSTFSLLFVSLILFPICISAQITVPLGWETKDSIRFGAWGPVPNGNQVSPYDDTLGVNFEMGFDDRPPTDVPGGHRVGISSQDYADFNTNILKCSPMLVAEWMKERVFYPSQDEIWPYSLWRYNDINLGHGTWNDNHYDANDISSYAEYPLDPSIVIDTFRTNRFPSSPNSLVRYGNEGRVILGYSDMRNARNLFTLMSQQFFNNTTYTPTVTNAILEFNIDTTSINLDSTSFAADTVPLLRVQILFKAGLPNSTSILPFVPFKTASQPTNAGWWQIIDTVITKKNYKTLADCYRTEDTVNGSAAHSWMLNCLMNLPIG